MAKITIIRKATPRGVFSYSSVLLSGIGAFVGLWIGFKCLDKYVLGAAPSMRSAETTFPDALPPAAQKGDEIASPHTYACSAEAPISAFEP
jgi:hypothetical protein